MKTKKTTTAAATRSSYVLRDFSGYSFSSLNSFLAKTKQIFTKNSTLLQSGGKKKKLKRLIPVAILIVLVGIVLVASSRTIASSSKQQADTRSEIKGPKKTLTLNKEFFFPLLDSKGKQVTKIKYTIETAELRDEIIVKGQKATAVKGRTFLILTIKIVNDYDKGISVNARDYIRLSVNNQQSELVAADIHNDPVSIQAISTKVTRLGFPINDTDTAITLSVGEIKSDKESIALPF